MNNTFLLIFKKIIREANYDNTYKMAWAKAIVELSNNKYSEAYEITITLKEIALKILKYYWNQTIFFNLIQGSNLIKKPVIIQIVNNLISKYYLASNKSLPELFERVEDKFESLGLTKEYYRAINQVVSALKKDVSYRFLILDKQIHSEIYLYNKNDDFLIIKTENLKSLYDNQQDLYDLINYRWSLILESFNSSPRINKKVRIMDDREIKRASLNKYRYYLDFENPEKICFICETKIEENDISIDHVIPWSYLYSDDIWNLVYVHRCCNSSKSNITPSETYVKRLIDRNNHLLLSLENINGKIVDELRLAIEKDYVNKFWIGSKM